MMNIRCFVKHGSIFLAVLIIGLCLTSPVNADVVFQDDFNTYTSGWTPSDSSAGHKVTGGTTSSPGKGEPKNWTGWIRYGTATIGISANEGMEGSACLKIGPEITSQANQVGLVKYLGPQGYNELYIRYYVRFDQNWRWGNGQNGSFVFYKWLRIWQNVSLADVMGTSGVSIASEMNRGAIVTGIYDDSWAEFQPYYSLAGMKDATNQTVNCSTNKTCDIYYYFPYVSGTTSGFLTGNFGGIDSQGYWTTTQKWHSIETHIKLANSFNGSGGVWETWVDGIKQVPATYASFAGTGAKVTTQTIPTATVGTGMNYIVLHDNQTGTYYWDSQKYVYIDNVVVSTTYIGPVCAKPTKVTGGKVTSP